MNLVSADANRLLLHHEGIDTVSYEVSREPLALSTETVRYYEGIVGLANYVYEMAVRLLQLLFCSWDKPWPKWSWTTTKLVREELIHLKKESGGLKSHEFFRHLVEEAYLPFSSSKDVDLDLITSELVQRGNRESHQILIRRTYHGDLLTQVSIMTYISPQQQNEICTFSRKNREIQEWQQNRLISRQIKEEGALVLNYADRIAFKREVVQEGMDLCGVKVVSQNSGLPVDRLLDFFEESIFALPKNGSTSVFYNQKSQELELRAVVSLPSYQELSAKVATFNRDQVRPPGNTEAICRAELTRIRGDDPNIVEVILAIKKVD